MAAIPHPSQTSRPRLTAALALALAALAWPGAASAQAAVSPEATAEPALAARRPWGRFDLSVHMGAATLGDLLGERRLTTYYFEATPRLAVHLGRHLFAGPYGVLGARAGAGSLSGDGVWGAGLMLGAQLPVAQRWHLQPELGAAYVYSPIGNKHTEAREGRHDVRIDAAVRVVRALASGAQVGLGPFFKASVPGGSSGLSHTYVAIAGVVVGVGVPVGGAPIGR